MKEWCKGARTQGYHSHSAASVSAPDDIKMSRPTKRLTRTSRLPLTQRMTRVQRQMGSSTTSPRARGAAWGMGTGSINMRMGAGNTDSWMGGEDWVAGRARMRALLGARHSWVRGRVCTRLDWVRKVARGACNEVGARHGQM